jgi:hypothetical protein
VDGIDDLSRGSKTPGWPHIFQGVAGLQGCLYQLITGQDDFVEKFMHEGRWFA